MLIKLMVEIESDEQLNINGELSDWQEKRIKLLLDDIKESLYIKGLDVASTDYDYKA